MVQMEEQILLMDNITVIYPNGFAANKNVRLACNRGSIHALLGENGAGKTTLMKVLFGSITPTEGQIYLKGKPIQFRDSLDAIQHGVGMVHQHFMLVDELTVAENLVLGMEPKKRGLFDFDAAVKITDEIAKKYNFEIDARAIVGDCSVAVKQKLEILKALLRGAEILILDEPTAVLTPQEISELFVELKKLRDMNHTIVFISHKLNEVKSLCDSFTILRNGQVVDVGRIDDFTEQELSNLMVGRQVSFEISKDAPKSEGRELLRVQNLHYTNYEGKQLLKDVSFSLTDGRILGVAGVEGNGQNELSEIITGLRQFSKGDITIDGSSIKNRTVRQIRRLGVGSISEDRMTYGCAPNMSVRDNIIADRYFTGKYSKGIRLDIKAIQKDTNALIKQFDVACPSPDSMAGMLSGGNIQKIIAAREFSSDSKIIIANQPTRGIDVGSSEFIHSQLIKMTREKGASVLLISADLNELIKLSDSIIVMYNGEITAYFEDASKVTDVELGEYMLGVKKMSTEEIGRALQQ